MPIWPVGSAAIMAGERMAAMTTISTGQQRPESSAPAAIELRGVHKHFGAVQAVRGIDLSIAPR